MPSVASHFSWLSDAYALRAGAVLLAACQLEDEDPCFIVNELPGVQNGCNDAAVGEFVRVRQVSPTRRLSVVRHRRLGAL